MFVRLACAFAALAAVSMSGAARAANLVENGSFETGNFTGWTVEGSHAGVTTALGTYGPRTGLYFADLGDQNGYGALTQTVADDPGTPLTLTYYVASRGDVSTTFYAAWNGSLVAGSFLQNPDSNFQYERYSFTVIGTGSDVLALHATDIPDDLALDDVSLEVARLSPSTVPLPASAPLFGFALLALGGCGYGMNRRSASRTHA